jgi:hypothetical protein
MSCAASLKYHLYALTISEWEPWVLVVELF